MTSHQRSGNGLRVAKRTILAAGFMASLCANGFAQSITPASVSFPTTGYYLSQYVPAGYTLGTLIGGNPTPLSSLYGSLAAAQAAWPGVTIVSTTQYLDRVILQYAVNQAQTGGCGTLNIPFAVLYIDAQVVVPAPCVHLQGSPGVSGFVTQTELRTQSMAASTAAVSLVGGTSGGSNGWLGYVPVLKNISFEAYNTGIQHWSAPGVGGVAETGFVTNSVALDVNNASNGTVTEGVSFANYDQPHSWSVGNVYVLTFKDTWYTNNNKGIYFAAPLANSFERMTWIGGGASANNYGVYINLPGGGADIYLDHMSFDYNIVNEIAFTGLAPASNDDWTSLHVTNSHFETSDTFSGTTTARISNNGNLFIADSEGYELGANTVGWITPTFYARTAISNTLVPGVDHMPVVYTTDAASYLNVTGVGLFERYGQDVLLLRSASGDFMQAASPLSYVFSTSFHPTLNYQQHLMLVAGTVNITIDPDSTANHAIGTVLEFITTDALIKTFVEGAGVTITPAPGAAGLTFGGAPGKIVGLTKTGTNAYIETGQGT